MTRSGAVVGTPNYMPPEQAAGRTRAIGPAADVWALGALLYEVLTGRPAFRGDTALDTLDLVRTADPIPPGRLHSQVPIDLETICLKCLHKEPAQRYPNGTALGDDLDRFLQGRPIRARRTGLLGRLTLWCRRHPGVAALTAALALLLVAGTVVSTVLAVRATTAETDAKRQLVAARLAQAQAVRRSRQQGQRRDGLAAIAEAARLAHELKLDASVSTRAGANCSPPGPMACGAGRLRRALRASASNRCDNYWGWAHWNEWPSTIRVVAWPSPGTTSRSLTWPIPPRGRDSAGIRRSTACS